MLYCPVCHGVLYVAGLAVTFVSDDADIKVLNDVQGRFEVNITELPDEIDLSSYSKYLLYLFVSCSRW